MALSIMSNKQGVNTTNGFGRHNPGELSCDVISSKLWVGSLAADVSDSDLRNLFGKHGGVDSVTCYPSRNYAFIHLKCAEDAKRARENLQGTVLRGNPLKIEFVKPAKPCKSLWVSCFGTSISKEDLEEEFSKFGKIEDFRFLWHINTAYVDYYRLEDATKAFKAMNGKKKAGTLIHVDYLRSHSRKHIPPSEGQKGDEEQRSKILIISYPPAVHIDEQMLHNAMILFGEIEKIRSFPSRYYTFVEFRSMEEAQCAKEGLQGKLFSDPRISIAFLTKELGPNQYHTGFLPGNRGPMPDASSNELPFQAGQLDVTGQSIVPNSFHGRVTRCVGGHDTSMQPFASPGSDFRVSDPNSINIMGGLNWRSSPSNPILSSPSARMNASTKPTTGACDIYYGSQIEREPKRLRTDGAMHVKEKNDQVLLSDQIYGGVNGVVPSNTRFTSRSPGINRPDVNYMWRGIIAKGGAPVCHARCIPVGDKIEYNMPEIINCSARTGLDMLAKHYADAVGFDIVLFLPDSEEGFSSYTEFLQYLGHWKRAAVAKFDDGTTLFLVPPSDFLTKVLKVSGPERLYGVVLKFPQHASDITSGPSISQPQYVGDLHVPSQDGYGVVPQDNKILHNNYGGFSNEHPQLHQDMTGQFIQVGNAFQLEEKIMSQRQANPSTIVNDSNVAVTINDHIQGHAFNIPHNDAVASTENFGGQSPQVALPMQATPQYQLDYPRDMHDVSGVNAVTSSSQVHGTNVYEPQNIVPGGVENAGTHLPEQKQQLPSALHGASQLMLESDADKNERYRSTLQLAANLLLQIHQKRACMEAGETDRNH